MSAYAPITTPRAGNRPPHSLTLYKLDAVLSGDLDELIDALRTAEQQRSCRPANFKLLNFKINQKVITNENRST